MALLLVLSLMGLFASVGWAQERGGGTPGQGQGVGSTQPQGGGPMMGGMGEMGGRCPMCGAMSGGGGHGMCYAMMATGGLLALSASAALIGATVFLVRRSRPPAATPGHA